MKPRYPQLQSQPVQRTHRKGIQHLHLLKITDLTTGIAPPSGTADKRKDLLVLSRCRARREHLKGYQGLAPENQGRHLASTVFCVPCSLDRARYSLVVYRSTSLIPLGPYSRPMPRILGGSLGGLAFLYERGTPVTAKARPTHKSPA